MEGNTLFGVDDDVVVIGGKRSPRRKTMVCLQEGCMKCDYDVIAVPPDCPVQILHVLTVEKAGVRAMPRQSGKTTALVEMANKLVGHGQRVALITPALSCANQIKRGYGLSDDVLVRTVGGWHVRDARGGNWRDLSAHDVGFFLFDEVNPRVVEEIMGHFPVSYAGSLLHPMIIL